MVRVEGERERRLEWCKKKRERERSRVSVVGEEPG